MLNKTIYECVIACVKGFEPALSNMELDVSVISPEVKISEGLNSLSGLLYLYTSDTDIQSFDVTKCLRFSTEFKEYDNITVVSVLGNKYKTSKCELNYIYSFTLTLVNGDVNSFKYEITHKGDKPEDSQLLAYRVIVNANYEISFEFFQSSEVLLELAKRTMENLYNVKDFKFSKQCALGYGGLTTYSKELNMQSVP